MYSIVNKLPKRADHYWFIHIENVDAPDTLEYSVSIPEPGALYFITMRLGFRVEPKVTAYLRQVVEDLVEEGRLDLRSTYPSLRGRGIAGRLPLHDNTSHIFAVEQLPAARQPPHAPAPVAAASEHKRPESDGPGDERCHRRDRSADYQYRPREAYKACTVGYKQFKI